MLQETMLTVTLYALCLMTYLKSVNLKMGIEKLSLRPTLHQKSKYAIYLREKDFVIIWCSLSIFSYFNLF